MCTPPSHLFAVIGWISRPQNSQAYVTYTHTDIRTYGPPFLSSGGPLHLGDIEDIGYGESPRIRCPWHHWCFDLNNGRQVRPHYNGACTVSFPARITKDGKIEIGFNSLHSSYFTNSDF